MRLTIILDDKIVYKNQKAYDGLNLSTVPSNLHALQWYDDYGVLEWKDKPNETITEFPDWASDALVAWEAAEAAENIAKQPIVLSYEQKLALIRIERDKRLVASDWTQLADVISLNTEEWKASWDLYRQALRDLPNQSSLDVDNPNWPIPPQ